MTQKNEFIIYKASAGAGKTEKIKERYLQIAVDNQNPLNFKKILAITFTNKATQEMKDRIINALHKSNGQEANNVLKKILHNYSFFSISTIDSFFQKIVWEFLREIKENPGIEVEMDKEKVIRDIVKILYEKANKDENLRKWLISFVKNNLQNDKYWDITNSIENFAQIIFSEKLLELNNNILPIKDLLKIEEKINNFLQYKNKLIKQTGKEALNKIHCSGFNVKDILKGTMYNFFENMSNGILDTKKNKLKDFIDKEEKYFKQKDRNKPKYKQLYNDLNNILKKFVKKFDEKRYYSYKALKETFYQYGLLYELQTILTDYRKKNNILLISDIPILIKRIISQSDVPFIYEKTGNTYRHYIIDEFQDTSLLQWENFKFLIYETLSYAGGSAMMVGDIKQSIYRWRGGNWELLNEIEKDIKNCTGNDEVKIINIKENWRSRKNIIEFNNNIFSILAENIENYLIKINNNEYYNIKEIYNKHLKQKLPDEPDEKKNGGYVKLNLFQKNLNNDYEEKIIEFIKKLINKHQYKQNDITCLFRTNKEASTFASKLLENGFSVVTSESLSINDSKSIRFIINLLKYFDNQNDEIIKTQLQYEYSNGNDSLFYDFEKKEWNNLLTKINRKIDYWKSIPVYDAVIDIIDCFEFNNDKNETPYLLLLEEKLLEFTNKYPVSVNDFLEWWESESSNFFIQLPENVDAIQLLTIHKAKGLSNKVIILPYCNWEIINYRKQNTFFVNLNQFNEFKNLKSFPVIFKNNLEKTKFVNDFYKERYFIYVDNLNLLYVAFTRAKDILYVNASVNKNDFNKKSFTRVSGWLASTFEQLENSLTNVNIYKNNGNKKEIESVEIEYGEILKNKSSGNNSTQKKIDTINFYKWNNNITIKQKNKEFNQLNSKLSEKIDFGILMHYILSKIYTKDDVQTAIEKEKNKFDLDENKIKNIENTIKRILNKSSMYFEKNNELEIKTEASILTDNGQIIRPDRIIIDKKKERAIIIDYKFTKENEEHKKQISHYKKELEKMYNYNIETVLIYVFEDDVKIYKQI